MFIFLLITLVALSSSVEMTAILGLIWLFKNKEKDFIEFETILWIKFKKWISEKLKANKTFMKWICV